MEVENANTMNSGVRYEKWKRTKDRHNKRLNKLRRVMSSIQDKFRKDMLCKEGSASNRAKSANRTDMVCKEGSAN